MEYYNRLALMWAEAGSLSIAKMGPIDNQASSEPEILAVATEDAGTQRVEDQPARSAAVATALRDVFLHPVVAFLITVCLLCLCTWWIYWLRDITGYGRPYTILYLIPVAVASAFLGTRGGIVASAFVLLLVRIYFLNDNRHGWELARFPNLAEGIDFATLAIGIITIAVVTGRLRSTLGMIGITNGRLEDINIRLALANQQLEEANAQILDNERQRQQFNHDVLLAVTGGKLRLVDRTELPPEDLKSHRPGIFRDLKQSKDASDLRRDVQKVLKAITLDRDRAADLLTATTEAATNAVKHGGGGQARVWITPDGISVLVEDNGQGISPAHLARATLEKGYSTLVSLGMGFHLMLECSDALYLTTGEGGTAVLLQVSNGPRVTESDALLARYKGL